MSDFLGKLLSAIPLRGRSNFYNHLLQQEIPFWMKQIYGGKLISEQEVETLISVRGFNASETRCFRAIVNTLNRNAKSLRRQRPPESKQHSFMTGYEDGSLGRVRVTTKDRHYWIGYLFGENNRNSAQLLHAKIIGYTLPTPSDPDLKPKVKAKAKR